MLRTINFTGRSKINRADITISIEKINKKTYFDIELDLDDYNIKSDAKLFLEVWDKTSYQRFDFGTIGDYKIPPPDERQLTEIQVQEMVRFKLLAIDQSDRIGRIISHTRPIQVFAPEVDESRKSSLLPVVRSDIGNSVWKIHFEHNDERPILMLNNKFDPVTVKEMLRAQSKFTSLVYPAAFREILKHAIFFNDIRDSDGDTWDSKWLELAFKLPGIEPLSSENSEIQDIEWIDEVISQFCKQFSMIDIMIESIS